MAHAENEVTISKPPEEVYSFIADGLNNTKWRSGVISIELKSGESGQVGAEYKQLIKGPGGRAVAGDYKLTVAEPGKQLSFAVTAGPVHPNGDYYLESVSNGTKVRFVLDVQPKGLARLISPLIQKTMNSEIAQLANLKGVLESA
jgi:carbon monoxide dehydrogenase subunit G